MLGHNFSLNLFPSRMNQSIAVNCLISASACDFSSLNLISILEYQNAPAKTLKLQQNIWLLTHDIQTKIVKIKLHLQSSRSCPKLPFMKKDFSLLASRGNFNNTLMHKIKNLQVRVLTWCFFLLFNLILSLNAVEINLHVTFFNISTDSISNSSNHII